MIRVDAAPYLLKFKTPSRTSREVLTEKLTFFIRIKDDELPGREGFGEVPVFKGLSAETPEEVVAELNALANCENAEDLLSRAILSSVKFGVESALRSLRNENGLIFESEFTDGSKSIRINGLVWMNPVAEMQEEAFRKIESGFKCVKFKIGAREWEDEIALVRKIRERFGTAITIRVDANGAFTEDDVMPKLEELAALGVHSIEQPVKAGQPEAMRRICKNSPLPIALDEELIGVTTRREKEELLDFIRPQYLVLKPALCGGFSGASEWIDCAGKEERGIGWWLTSALESNVGLNAIAQFAGQHPLDIPQGLGTGGLYTNNLPSPLQLVGENLTYTGPADCYYQQLREILK
ncbi:MAG: o-succinylbenzoate synthase [Muribaculaceae bacterium]|nr:o-succinylbenzoate synthase [Muribaculaceae bacterium]